MALGSTRVGAGRRPKEGSDSRRHGVGLRVDIGPRPPSGEARPSALRPPVERPCCIFALLEITQNLVVGHIRVQPEDWPRTRPTRRSTTVLPHLCLNVGPGPPSRDPRCTLAFVSRSLAPFQWSASVAPP